MVELFSVLRLRHAEHPANYSLRLQDVRSPCRMPRFPLNSGTTSSAAVVAGPLQTRTKIVATVGPACRSLAKLKELVQAGVDVFRLNMAHAKREEHLEVVNWIRDVSKELGRPIAILADLAGPKIRLGQIPNDLISCHEGELFRFVRGTTINNPGELTTTYEPLVDELVVGNSVMLADGTVGLVVEEKGADYALCRVTQGASSVRGKVSISRGPS